MAKEPITLQTTQVNGEDVLGSCSRIFESEDVTCSLTSGNLTIKITPAAQEIGTDGKMMSVSIYPLAPPNTSKSFTKITEIEITGNSKKNIFILLSS